MSLKPVDVLVYGSAIVDFICYVERLPQPGETLHGHKFANGFGGKGANQCVAAARLGAKCAIVAALGSDSWGDAYLRQLQQENIDVSHVRQCEGQTTGIAQIAVSKDGENHIIIVAGANNSLAEIDVDASAQLFKTAKILLCQLEAPVMSTLYALKQFQGVSILNAAPAMPNSPRELIQAASILCINETEAEAMTGVGKITSIEKAKIAIIKLSDMGANTVVITLGAEGAVYAEKDSTTFIHVPAKKVDNVVDTTGAGDAFLGALAFHMSYFPEKPLHQHIWYANVQASYSVQFPGTQSSFPDSATALKHTLEEYTYNTI